MSLTAWQPILTLILAAGPPTPEASLDPSLRMEEARPAIAARRIIKHFDFNEQPLGNFGPLPLFWQRHVATGFPLYLEGRLDQETGRTSAPSFRIDLDGGSLGYRYLGRDIAVRTDSEYLVVGWVRTSTLRNARAYLTASWLDRKGDVLWGPELASVRDEFDDREKATTYRSRLAGGEGWPEDWMPLSIPMGKPLPGARYIGLAVWLTQAQVWTTPPADRFDAGSAVLAEDVTATAWFDDLTVYRLPQVTLTASRPGNLFGPDDPVVLETHVRDPDAAGLHAVLRIRDAGGQLVEERTVPIELVGREDPLRLPSEGGEGSARDLDGIADCELRIANSWEASVRNPESAIRNPQFRDQKQNRLRAASAATASQGVRHSYDLPPGWYRADLMVSTGSTVLINRALHLVRLGPPVHSTQARGRSFGLVLPSDEPSPAGLAAQEAYLRHLGVQFVKLPLRARPAEPEGVSAIEQARSPESRAPVTAGPDPRLEIIRRSGVRPVGILPSLPLVREPPQPLVREPREPLVRESLLAPNAVYEDLWSRYAGQISIWQFGPDGEATSSAGSQHLLALRRAMPGGETVLAVALDTPERSQSGGSAESALPTSFPEIQPDDLLSVSIPPGLSPEDLAGQISSLRSRISEPGPSAPAAAHDGTDDRLHEGRQRLWLHVRPLPVGEHPRLLRLGDLTRRLSEAYFHQVEGIFLDAVWDGPRVDLAGPANPQEDFIVFRTVVDLLAGAAPLFQATIDGDARFLVFERDGRGVLLAWDPHAPPDGREHVLPLGLEAEELDLWGRRTPLETARDPHWPLLEAAPDDAPQALEISGSGTDAGLRRLRIGPVPKFIINTCGRLTSLRAGFHLEAGVLEAGSDPQECYVILANPFPRTIHGQVRLIVPLRGEAQPERFRFHLQPGELLRQAVTLRFPVNAEAGIHRLLGVLDLEGLSEHPLLAPADFKVGLREVDVEADVQRVGGRLLVRQVVRNRGQDPIRLERFVVTPSGSMQRRIEQFEPGSPMPAEFVLGDARDLSGQQIRVGLRETHGYRVWSRLLTIP